MSKMKPTSADLRRFIIEHFNDDELETFCFNYFPEAKREFTRGMPFSQKVEMLIGYCQRRKLEVNLLTNLAQERPTAYQAQFTTQIQAAPVIQPRQRDPRQVFVSHAHEDGELAGRLAADLEAEGYPVWLAPDSIQPGEKWAAAISRGLDESGIFVLLLTPHAVKSRWVRSETDAAIELEHEDAMRFIPLQVAACKLPALWRVYQRIPFRRGYEAGLAGLLAALDRSGAVRRPATAQGSPRPARSTPKPPPKNSFIDEKSGLEFVRIPAGKFLYGNKKEKKELPEFWMGKTPVTNAAYARFVQWGHKPPSHWKNGKPPPDKLDHPVVRVSWHDAKAFTDWAGLRLPTEEEWEKAARGTDGREYPWDNREPTSALCNFGGNVGDITPVGHYSPQGDSPYGCADMSGNVWEWTDSWYEKDKYRSVRGGSWPSNQRHARVAGRLRHFPHFSHLNFGFRAVSPVVLSADF